MNELDELAAASERPSVRRPAARPRTAGGNLRACPDCRGAVSRRSASCPRCGAPMRQSVGPLRIVLRVITFAFVVLAIAAGLSIDGKPNERLLLAAGYSLTPLIMFLATFVNRVA